MNRALSALLSLVFFLGAVASSSCKNVGQNRQRAASLNQDGGGAYKRMGLYARPKIDRDKSGARINTMLLSQSNKNNTRLVIDISQQKGYLLVNGKVAVETPVSTARPGKYTPRGTFTMTQRVRTGKVSTIYGVEMPYWMRLSGTVFGVHAGHLPGYPASAGCVRLPMSAAQLIFDHTTYGTKVSIYSSWNGA
jgi:lipoprotein-anchoring transpeptidase ErfK/SrfK